MATRLLAAALAGAAAASTPTLTVSIDGVAGTYSVLFDGAVWFTSPAVVTVCVAGTPTRLTMGTTSPSSGSDAWGAFTGVTVPWGTSAGGDLAYTTFQTYAAQPAALVVSTIVPGALTTAGCGGNAVPSLAFPAFNTSAGVAPSLHAVSWRGDALGDTLVAAGLGNLPRGQLDDGPVLATLPGDALGRGVVISTLDNHKIVVQQQTADGALVIGPSAAIPQLPKGWGYRVALFASYGGATATAVAWGAAMQAFHGTTRSPSVSLQQLGYYTDGESGGARGRVRGRWGGVGAGCTSNDSDAGWAARTPVGAQNRAKSARQDASSNIYVVFSIPAHPNPPVKTERFTTCGHRSVSLPDPFQQRLGCVWSSRSSKVKAYLLDSCNWTIIGTAALFISVMCARFSTGPPTPTRGCSRRACPRSPTRWGCPCSCTRPSGTPTSPRRST